MKRIKKKLLPFFKNPRKLIDKKYVCEYLLAAILIVGIFFRFYNTPARYGFDFDPTRDALISQYGAENFKFPIVGPKSGIAPFTFGPWYYYQLIGARLILHTDYAPWIYIGTTSVVAIFVMYLIGKALEDKKLGLILALLMALSPAELGPITGLSNPNLIPIQATLTLLFFIWYMKNKLPWYCAALWGIIIGIGINNHYQMVGLLILPAMVIVLRKFSIKEIVLFVGGIIVTFLPLLYYNITNDWQTIRGYIYFQTVGKYAVYTPNRWLFYVRDFWPSFWSYVVGVPVLVGVCLLAYTIVVAAFVFFKHKVRPIYFYLFAAFFINFILLRYFAGPRENYYFIYLHPFIILFFGWALWQSFKYKILSVVGICVATIVGLFVIKEDVRRLSSEPLYLQISSQTQAIQKRYPSQKVILFHCGGVDKNRTQAITYFLYRDNKIDTNGVKLGIKGTDCPTMPAKRKYVSSFNGYLVEGNSTDDLEKIGWMQVTQESVYKDALEWWKKE